MKESFEKTKQTYENIKDKVKEKWETFKNRFESFKDEKSKEILNAESPDEMIEIGKKIQEEGETLKAEEESLSKEEADMESDNESVGEDREAQEESVRETEADLEKEKMELEERRKASEKADQEEADKILAKLKGEEVEGSEGIPQEGEQETTKAENMEGGLEEGEKKKKMNHIQLLDEIDRLQRHVDRGAVKSLGSNYDSEGLVFADALEERKREYNEMMEKLRGENKEEISEEAREIQRHYLEKEKLYTDLRKENGNDWDDPELNRRLLLNVAYERDPERLKVMMENFGYDKEAFKNNIINETNKGFGPKSSENWLEIMKLAGMSEDEIHENAVSKLTKDSHIHLKEPGNASYMVESIINARDVYGISDEEWARIAHDIYFKDPEKMGRAMRKNDSVASLFVDRGGWIWNKD